MCVSSCVCCQLDDGLVASLAAAWAQPGVWAQVVPPVTTTAPRLVFKSPMGKRHWVGDKHTGSWQPVSAWALPPHDDEFMAAIRVLHGVNEWLDKVVVPCVDSWVALPSGDPWRRAGSWAWLQLGGRRLVVALCAEPPVDADGARRTLPRLRYLASWKVWLWLLLLLVLWAAAPKIIKVLLFVALVAASLWAWWNSGDATKKD